MWRIILLIVFVLGFFSQLTSQPAYITKSGKKYHTENRSSLSKSKIAIELSEAIDKGYTPCKKCKPDTKLGALTKTTLLHKRKNKLN